MPQGRLWIALIVLAALAGRSAAQTAPYAPQPAAGGCDPCPPACAAAPRVKVILPPPEVVFCPPAPRCGLFHHAAPCPAPCTTCAPTAVAPVTAAAPATPGGGLMNFNMTYTMPSMSYQMTPVMMGFGGMGLSAGTFGMGGLGMGGFGMPMVQPAGVNVGLAGLQMGLSGSALAAALGLAPAAGLTGTGTSAAEMQVLRALLGRAAGNGAADGDLATRVRQLEARITAEAANLQQMRRDMTSDMTLGMQGLGVVQQRLEDIEKRLRALEPPKKTPTE